MLDLTCFGTNYIGIRGECSPSPNNPISGLFINDIPGISLKLASNTADEETVTGVKLLRQIEQQAIRDTWVDVLSKLSSDVHIGKVIDNRQIGAYDWTDDNPTYLAPVAADVGFVVEKNDCDNLTALQINFVDIRGNSTVSGKTLAITDGCTTQTYDFDIQACEPVRIWTNFISYTGKVFVTVDASDLELENNSIFDGCSCRSRCDCATYGCFNVYGWNGTSQVSQSYGMVTNISCVCQETELLCALKYQIAPLVQLKMAILLMYEVLNSKRCNFMVMNSDEDAEKMIQVWDLGFPIGDKHRHGEYWRKLKQVVNAVKGSFKSMHSKCISCGTVKVVESIP